MQSTPMSKITKKKAGVDIEIPIDKVWNSICRIIRLAQISSRCTQADQKQFTEFRLALLVERLEDIESMEFHEIKE